MSGRTIALLLGGTSAERHVSMATGLGVADALSGAGYDVRLFDPALGTDAEIDRDRIELPTTTAPTPEELAALDRRNVIRAVEALPDVDCVFLGLHGTDGEDGTIQSLLELRGLPYTGSGILASAIAMDKATSKVLFREADVSTARSFVVNRDRPEERADTTARAEQRTGFPVVVKPNDGGSTVGLTIVQEPSGIQDAIAKAAEYSQRILCEEFVAGREVTVTIIGDEPMPVLEIRPKEGIYDYANKYTAGRTEYLCPAPIDDALALELQTLALRAFEIVGCYGYGRVDFRIDEAGEPWCLEINTLPGMTGTSLVPKAAAAAGMSYVEVCERIVQAAIARG